MQVIALAPTQRGGDVPRATALHHVGGLFAAGPGTGPGPRPPRLPTVPPGRDVRSGTSGRPPTPPSPSQGRALLGPAALVVLANALGLLEDLDRRLGEIHQPAVAEDARTIDLVDPAPRGLPVGHGRGVEEVRAGRASTPSPPPGNSTGADTVDGAWSASADASAVADQSRPCRPIPPPVRSGQLGSVWEVVTGWLARRIDTLGALHHDRRGTRQRRRSRRRRDGPDIVDSRATARVRTRSDSAASVAWILDVRFFRNRLWRSPFEHGCTLRRPLPASGRATFSPESTIPEA